MFTKEQIINVVLAGIAALVGGITTAVLAADVAMDELAKAAGAAAAGYAALRAAVAKIAEGLGHTIPVDE